MEARVGGMNRNSPGTTELRNYSAPIIVSRLLTPPTTFGIPNFFTAAIRDGADQIAGFYQESLKKN